MKYTFLLLALFSYLCVSGQKGSNAASRTTSIIKERLVAYGFHFPPSNPIPTDTVTYYYSGENGSDTVDYNFFLYPQVTTPNHQTIKCDSYIYKIGTFQRGTFTYNTSGDAITIIREDTTGSGTGTLMLNRYSLFSYAAGVISADSEWSPSANYDRYHSYDGSGYLVLDSLWDPVALMPINKTEYTNNAAGLVLTATGYSWASGVWSPGSITTYTYDGSNRLTNKKVQYYTLSVLTNYRDDSFYYAVPGNKYTYSATAYWTSGAWVPASIYRYHINGANQWDTVYGYSWNTSTLSLDTSLKSYITYDAYGNMKSSGDQEFITSDHAYVDTPFELNIYYYQTYTSTEGTNTMSLPGAAVNIFPNPVSGTLHVKMEGLAAGKKANLTITNMLGQTVISSKIMDGDNLMNVSALGAGVYIVSVSGDGMNYTGQFVKVN